MEKTTIAVWALLALLWPVSLLALNHEYEQALERELRWFVLTAPPYVMSDSIKPDDPIERGVDCSRLIYLCYKAAAIGTVKRTTARGMRLGMSGWVGKEVKPEEADGSSLIWFTWKNRPNRIDGHVGAIQVGFKSGLLEIVHASQSAGKTIRQQYGGVLERDTSSIRRITIGERN